MVARKAHNLEVSGSNPLSATIIQSLCLYKMEVTDDLVIECARSLGFSPPKVVKVQKWDSSHEDLFPEANMVRHEIKPSNIKVSRAVTFSTKLDLGEWWISYPQCLRWFRVNMKVFIRDKKINQILKIRKLWQF